MDYSWWDCPAYEPFPRRHSGLLNDDEYDYGTLANAPKHVPWPPPQRKEEVLLEEYIPTILSGG
jgi:hypothetical protein